MLRESTLALSASEILLESERIQVVKARYCRYLDGKQWRELLELFAPDCLFELDPLERQHLPEPLRASTQLPLQSFMELLRTVLVSDAQSVHHVHAPEIEFSEAAIAHGIWAVEDYVTSTFGNFRGYGHYHETYRKIDGS